MQLEQTDDFQSLKTKFKNRNNNKTVPVEQAQLNAELLSSALPTGEEEDTVLDENGVVLSKDQQQRLELLKQINATLPKTSRQGLSDDQINHNTAVNIANNSSAQSAAILANAGIKSTPLNLDKIAPPSESKLDIANAQRDAILGKAALSGAESESKTKLNDSKSDKENAAAKDLTSRADKRNFESDPNAPGLDAYRTTVNEIRTKNGLPKLDLTNLNAKQIIDLNDSAQKSYSDDQKERIAAAKLEFEAKNTDKKIDSNEKIAGENNKTKISVAGIMSKDRGEERKTKAQNVDVSAFEKATGKDQRALVQSNDVISLLKGIQNNPNLGYIEFDGGAFTTGADEPKIKTLLTKVNGLIGDIRHDNFGSALTDNEKKSFEKIISSYLNAGPLTNKGQVFKELELFVNQQKNKAENIITARSVTMNKGAFNKKFGHFSINPDGDTLNFGDNSGNSLKLNSDVLNKIVDNEGDTKDRIAKELYEKVKNKNGIKYDEKTNKIVVYGKKDGKITSTQYDANEDPYGVRLEMLIEHGKSLSEKPQDEETDKEGE